MHVICPKGKGSSIMVSDFIDECNGYLWLTDDELECAKIKYMVLIFKEKHMCYLNMEKARTSEKFLLLSERGKYHKGMKLEEMRAEIASHTDFKEEKTMLEHFLNNLGHACIMLPKFYCELNPIERYWGQATLNTKALNCIAKLIQTTPFLLIFILLYTQ